MFRNCSQFNQPINFNTSNVTNMAQMFQNCSLFNQSVSSFDTSKVTNMVIMFSFCLSFKQSLATFDMTSATNVSNMLQSCDINETGTTTNYDDTLIAWELQDLVNGLNFNGGNSKYSATGEVARNAIIADDLWTITDGGLI
jgi:surface protein